MTAYVGVGGVWKTVNQPAVGVSGAFNDDVDGWVGVGGAWKKFYTYLVLSLSNSSTSRTELSPTASTVSITFLNTGVLRRIGNSTVDSSADWISPKPVASPGDYEVAYTALVSGSGPTSGAALGVYSALSTSRTWSATQSGVGTHSGVWRFRVREIANPSNYAEGDLTINAIVEP